MKFFDVSQDIDLNYMFSKVSTFISEKDKHKPIAHYKTTQSDIEKSGEKKKNG
ncbi:MAG: hypothetical protein Q4F95_09065 [Oscillospiraceae bacterium]|nr:hypothetical protein [Oscillospiraceae bacterium]